MTGTEYSPIRFFFLSRGYWPGDLRNDFKQTECNMKNKSERPGYYLQRHLIIGLLLLILFNVSQAQDTLHVSNNVHIPPGEVMEIPAGTVVFFHGYYHFTIEGSLQVSGSESAPVVFTAADTTNLWDTHLDEGGWNGLRFVSDESDREEAPSVLQHCIFEFSKASKEDFHNGGAISVYGERDLIIEDCLFKYNYAYRMGGAIYLNRNNAHIHKSGFEYNIASNRESELWAYGGGIAVYESRVVISWSEFGFNSATGMGGALNFEKSHPTVYNSIINNNYAPLGGGIGVVRSLSANVLSNNLIINNTALFFGGGMAFVDGSVVVANTNILHNTSAYGGGLYFNEISSPVFYNSIIRDNTMDMDVPNQVWIFDGVSGPEFYHCNIEGGFEDFYGTGDDDFQGVYLDNIDENPLFEDAETMDYSLKDSSPCIDAGFHDSPQLGLHPYDLAGNNRFSGIRADMGAYEYQDPFTYYSLHISVEGEGETSPATGEYFYQENEQVILAATPHENWLFEHWVTSQGNMTTGEIQIDMHSDWTVKAVFLPVTHITEASQQSFMLYPNPFTDQLYLQIPESLQGEEVVVSIYNLSGEKILQTSVSVTGSVISLPAKFLQLKQGLYFMKAEHSSGVYTHKIVRQ